MKNIIAAFLLSLGIAIAGSSIAYAIYAFKNFDHYVSVKGLAERTVKADDAIWQVRVNVVDNNLNAVYQQITNAQQKISAFLQQQGFKADEIQLLPIDVVDREAQPDNNKNTQRYSAMGGVLLHTTAVDKVVALQEKLSTLLQEGVVVSQAQASYYFTHLNDIKPGMLVDATANARKAAELFAQNSQNHLGKMRNASQGMFIIEDVAQQDYRANSSLMKNIRVVTSVEYFLQ